MARLYYPEGVAVDAAGNVFVADHSNHRIRKISPEGVVYTFAGNGAGGFADGPGATAQFYYPNDVAVDATGNVYVADGTNFRIRKITAGGVVSTLAGDGTQGFVDGPGAAARFSIVRGVAVDATGNVYVADSGNLRLRKISPAGEVSTLAGDGTQGFADGPGATAQFGSTEKVAVDAAGNLYVPDQNGHRIRKVSPSGDVTTLAGDGTEGFADGPGATARFAGPHGVAVDGAGNVYVSDESGHRLRKITPGGEVSTLAGDGTRGHLDGAGAQARFSNPEGLALDAAGNLYVADESNHRIRKVTPGGVVSTVAGSGSGAFSDGPVGEDWYRHPTGVAVDPTGHIFVSDAHNNRIRKVIPGGTITTLAGSGSYGFADGAGSAAQFADTARIALDGEGNVFVADRGNNRVRKVSPAGVVSTLAGNGDSGYVDGPAALAQFSGLSDVAVDAAGTVYVAETFRVRRIAADGTVTTLVGGTQVAGLAVDAAGTVYIAGGNKIQTVSPLGVVTPLAGSSTPGFADGTGSEAQFENPKDVALDAAGNLIVADANNYRIRLVTPAGVVTTLAGSGSRDFADGRATDAGFGYPYAVAVDASGTIYVADPTHDLIRRIR